MIDGWGAVRCVRDIHNDQVVFAWPVEMQGRGDGYVLAAQLAGSVGMVPEGYPDDLHHILEQVSTGEWSIVEREWLWTNCLHVLQPDQWWGTQLMWSADTGEFLCWYVDFRLPLVASGDSLNTRDLQLDIVVSPDGSWRWKDEDHYQLAIDLGYISSEERHAVESSRDEAVAAIKAGRFPFDGSLLDWQPPASLPMLPPTWAVP